MILAFLPTCLPPCLPGRVPARPISVCPHPPRLPPHSCSPQTPSGLVLRRLLSDARPTLPTPSLLHAAPCPHEDVPLEELPREHVPLEAGPCGDVPREQVLLLPPHMCVIRSEERRIRQIGNPYGDVGNLTGRKSRKAREEDQIVYFTEI